MSRSKFAAMLSGGDRRSIGRSNEIVSLVLREPQQLDELFACFWSEDAIVRMRAADALEKISSQKPEWLKPHRAKLLLLLSEVEQPELRWHLAQIVPRLDLRRRESGIAVAALRVYLTDRSSIVRTCALQGLADLAQQDPALSPSVRRLFEESLEKGTAAMRARARKLLAKIGK